MCGYPSVAHVFAPAPFGGLESVVGALALGQHDAGARVSVTAIRTSGDPPPPLVALLERKGVAVECISVGHRAYGAQRAAVRAALRQFAPDVVHTHGYRSDVVDAPVARTLGMPTVTTVHGFTGGGLRARAYEWLQIRAFRRFSAVVAVSQRLGADLVARGLDPLRVHVARNAWSPHAAPLPRAEARRLLGIPLKDDVVGWVGRLGAEKGPDVALRAFAAVSRPTARLSVVGAGEMEQGLRALADELGIECRVRWHGVVTEAGRLLSAFDVILISSWTEGTPMVLLEAMAAEVPVVTTAVGGIPDVVSSEEAILIAAGDEAGLADAVRTALGSGPDVMARARAARERLAREFALEPWIEQYRTIYESCLDG